MEKTDLGRAIGIFHFIDILHAEGESEDQIREGIIEWCPEFEGKSLTTIIEEVQETIAHAIDSR